MQFPHGMRCHVYHASTSNRTLRILYERTLRQCLRSCTVTVKRNYVGSCASSLFALRHVTRLVLNYGAKKADVTSLRRNSNETDGRADVILPMSFKNITRWFIIRAELAGITREAGDAIAINRHYLAEGIETRRKWPREFWYTCWLSLHLGRLTPARGRAAPVLRDLSIYRSRHGKTRDRAHRVSPLSRILSRRSNRFLNLLNRESCPLGENSNFFRNLRVHSSLARLLQTLEKWM